MNNSNNGLIVLGGLLVGIVVLGMILEFMDSQPAAAEFRPLEQMPAGATPTRDYQALAAAITPSLNITSTPAPAPRAMLESKIDRPTQTAVESNFSFTDAVPAADSPEFTADGMNACFSAYTRNRNEAENTCKGEWYPVDYAPRPHDEYWCATNSGEVGWLPVRLYDGRASETVKPFGSLNQCN